MYGKAEMFLTIRFKSNDFSMKKMWSLLYITISRALDAKICIFPISIIIKRTNTLSLLNFEIFQTAPFSQ